MIPFDDVTVGIKVLYQNNTPTLYGYATLRTFVEIARSKFFQSPGMSLAGIHISLHNHHRLMRTTEKPIALRYTFPWILFLKNKNRKVVHT